MKKWLGKRTGAPIVTILSKEVLEYLLIND